MSKPSQNPPKKKPQKQKRLRDIFGAFEPNVTTDLTITKPVKDKPDNKINK